MNSTQQRFEKLITHFSLNLSKQDGSKIEITDQMNVLIGKFIRTGNDKFLEELKAILNWYFSDGQMVELLHQWQLICLSLKYPAGTNE